jgi:hypothetical protein
LIFARLTAAPVPTEPRKIREKRHAEFREMTAEWRKEVLPTTLDFSEALKLDDRYHDQFYDFEREDEKLELLLQGANVEIAGGKLQSF